MPKKMKGSGKAFGLAGKDEEDGREDEERVIDPYDYRYRVFLYGGEAQYDDSDESEYKEPE